MDEAALRLSRYYLTQLALNACFGLVTAMALWAIGVPSPILWGIFAAVMRFVPDQAHQHLRTVPLHAVHVALLAEFGLVPLLA